MILKNFILAVIILMMSSCDNASQKRGFMENIGVCTGIENAEILKPLGYNYIEAGVKWFLVPDKSEDEFNEMLEKAQKAALPVKACNSFLPGNLKSVGPDAVHPEILAYVETAFRRAQRVGVEIIVFGSGGSRSVPDGFSPDSAREQFVSLCSEIALIASKYNVMVVLEPLNSNECNFITSVTEGAKIVEDVNHPSFRLLADIYHMKVDDEGPESIRKYGHLIKHVHVAEKEGRAAPGTHNEDLSPYYDALREVGYPGTMSIECRWEDLEKQAEKAIKTIKDQL